MKYILACAFLLIVLHQADAATRHLTSARNCAWSNSDHTAVDCFVKFQESGDNEFPFTALANDHEPYGRDIFNCAQKGEFGVIADYVPPANSSK